WKLNGTDVDVGMDFRYSVVEGSLLINNPNKTQDAGTYQCVATNSFGTIVSREAKLQFALCYRPSPPGSSRATELDWLVCPGPGPQEAHDKRCGLKDSLRIPCPVNIA
ncbi:Hypothetical predicted protein, partial [Marmota monax]